MMMGFPLWDRNILFTGGCPSPMYSYYPPIIRILVTGDMIKITVMLLLW